METENAVTKFNTLTERVDALFAQQRITPEDIADLDNEERRYLSQTATRILQDLKGEERDEFLNKIEPIAKPQTKQNMWEHNHYQVTRSVAKLMTANGIMPAAIAVAEDTGLSRQTVARHLKEYRNQPEYQAEMEQFSFMTTKILATVFNAANRGDIKAARLYFEAVGAMTKRRGNTVISEQNNYIQVNNTILSQENLNHLSAEQLNMIENIVRGSGGR